MRSKFLIAVAAALLAAGSFAQAGGRCGYGGGWGGGYYGGWGGGWGGWGGGWGGWGGGWGGWGGGWGWGGPSIGISFAAPVPVYRTVYVSRPRYVAYEYGEPTLVRAQARLSRMGYYPGPIDGDFGPMTSQALRDYQYDYGLPVTGRLDSRTRDSLGV